jgi:hypothetical protein
VICALLVIAGGHKILVAQTARASLSLVGVSAPAITVRALGAAEVALGTVAAVSPGLVSDTLVAAVYAAFCGFVVLLLVRQPAGSVDCGCFGGGEQRAGWLHVALNGAACSVAVAGGVVGAHGVGWILDRSPAVAPSLLIGLAAASYAAYLAYAVLPSAWSSYGTGAGQ